MVIEIEIFAARAQASKPHQRSMKSLKAAIAESTRWLLQWLAVDHRDDVKGYNIQLKKGIKGDRKSIERV